MTRILIGALSGWNYHERRQHCLATWMADGDDLGIQSLFLFGCPTATQPERIGLHALALPCPDDYASLPQRTLGFCRWALGVGSREAWGVGRETNGDPRLTPHAPRPDWDYLFKCDDDTYVSIPRLLAYDLAGRDYVGAEWKPGVGYGSGGAGYFLSRRAAILVAERMEYTRPGPFVGAEDLEVGKVMRNAGIEFSIEPRLIPFGSMENRPKRNNDLITLHGVQADAFLAAHAETGL